MTAPSASAAPGPAAAKAHPFFTIGHSNHPIGAFIGLLQGAGVELVADVRAAPTSRTNPQYDAAVLAAALAAASIGYQWLADLGGHRGRVQQVAPQVNAYWENRSFHNYADYATTDGFRGGLARLVDLGRAQRCAVMCAEAVWWRCHRRIIADYLIAAGETVCHILAKDHLAPAAMTAAARPAADGTLSCPL
jgi:uncharacterized protein (DUF488 family)